MKNSFQSIGQLLEIMATLRSPQGCPWDREQDHRTLRFHAVEEAYELLDAIDAGDDVEMVEELGDMLLQVVFHAQLARERGAFDFEAVTRNIVEKLIRRHPHVFGEAKAKTVDAVWAQWEQIKKAEKSGTRNERSSALDGIPRHLPALLRAEKLARKARKAGLMEKPKKRESKSALAEELWILACRAQAAGLSAEELLRDQINKQEKKLRRAELKQNKATPKS